MDHLFACELGKGNQYTILLRARSLVHLAFTYLNYLMIMKRQLPHETRLANALSSKGFLCSM
jgi:hypothetical protein